MLHFKLYFTYYVDKLNNSNDYIYFSQQLRINVHSIPNINYVNKEQIYALARYEIVNHPSKWKFANPLTQ